MPLTISLPLSQLPPNFLFPRPSSLLSFTLIFLLSLSLSLPTYPSLPLMIHYLSQSHLSSSHHPFPAPFFIFSLLSRPSFLYLPRHSFPLIHPSPSVPPYFLPTSLLLSPSLPPFFLLSLAIPPTYHAFPLTLSLANSLLPFAYHPFSSSRPPSSPPSFPLFFLGSFHQ